MCSTECDGRRKLAFPYALPSALLSAVHIYREWLSLLSQCARRSAMVDANSPSLMHFPLLFSLQCISIESGSLCCPNVLDGVRWSTQTRLPLCTSLCSSLCSAY